MKIWKDEEVKSLFCEVEKCKRESRSLKEAFYAHAEKFGRKTNSVRNYYYADVDNLRGDKNRAKRLGINVHNHEKNRFVPFDKVQEEELFEKIKNLVDKGMSVRSACRVLSNGDLTLMTRLQNKYQNLQRKLKPVDNIIPFKQKTLTDSEINSLFLGFVKLIKKSALEEMSGGKNSSQLSKNIKENLQLKKQNIVFKEENEELRKQVNFLKKENSNLKISLENAKNSKIKQKNQEFEKHILQSREKNNEEQSERV